MSMPPSRPISSPRWTSSVCPPTTRPSSSTSSGAPSEEAAEIYAASLLAIDVDNPAERGYLGMLAARLNLDEKLVEHLHATVEGATEKVGGLDWVA